MSPRGTLGPRKQDRPQGTSATVAIKTFYLLCLMTFVSLWATPCDKQTIYFHFTEAETTRERSSKLTKSFSGQARAIWLEGPEFIQRESYLRLFTSLPLFCFYDFDSNLCGKDCPQLNPWHLKELWVDSGTTKYLLFNEWIKASGNQKAILGHKCWLTQINCKGRYISFK